MKVLFRAILLLALAAAPVRADQPTPEEVFAAFDSLLGDAAQRDLYALPPSRYWRADVPQTFVLSGDSDLRAIEILSSVTVDIAAAAHTTVTIAQDFKPRLPTRLDLNTHYIVIAPRSLGTRFAAEFGVESDLRDRFVDGRWPSLLSFRRDDLKGGGARSSVIIVADDVPTPELQTLVAVSVVWATGGASVGEELGILDKPGSRRGLTELGKKAFVLMYHPELSSGMPLDEARAKARDILGLPE